MSRWEAFFHYLKQQILDIKDVQDRSSPVYTEVKYIKHSAHRAAKAIQIIFLI